MARATHSNEHRPYQGELRSGNFGPDTGHYHCYVEFYSMMCRHSKDGVKVWPTREEAWAAAGPRNGHVAVVGVEPETANSSERDPV